METLQAQRTSTWAPSGVVTFLTDFGTVDTYVGVMKGVLLQRAPSARPVDLTHAVPPQDVLQASWHLARAIDYFPAGTVHVAVVDPGVGSARSILVAEDRGQAFLAPDNGLLGPVLSEAARVYELDVERFALPEPSRTFHGRDVFTPAAAALASGLAPQAAGNASSTWQRASWPAVEERPGHLVVQALFADHFGNLITALPGARLEGAEWIAVVDGEALPLVGTYADVEPGAGLALIGSAGTLEISVREGSAAERFRAGSGTPIQLTKRTR